MSECERKMGGGREGGREGGGRELRNVWSETLAKSPSPEVVQPEGETGRAVEEAPLRSQKSQRCLNKHFLPWEPFKNGFMCSGI